jgi:hypothetical protein
MQKTLKVSFVPAVLLLVVGCSSDKGSETQDLPKDAIAFGVRGGLEENPVKHDKNLLTKSTVRILFKDGSVDSECTGTNNKGSIVTSSHCKIDCKSASIIYWDSASKSKKSAKCDSVKAGPISDAKSLVSSDKGLVAAGSFAIDFSKMKPVKGESVRIYYFDGSGDLISYYACKVENVDPTTFSHSCSTTPGASGAIIVSYKDETRVIGIHDEGKVFGDNGGSTALTSELE